ncbi:MAG TPA: hypothetical protein VFE50_24970 [Cyclobacteriaceae bacterium]|nr:hypothetical protein [Cyclobacteriaceae bacterium]
MKTSLNETVLLIVKYYGRKKLRARLESIHENLFTDPVKISFRERILRMFQ